MPGSSRSTARTAGRGGPASASGCRPWRRRSRRLALRRLRRLLRRRPRRAAGARPGRGRRPDHRGRPPRPHLDTWAEPIATDYRGVRVTTPPTEQLRARRARAPGDPRPGSSRRRRRRVRAGRRDRPGLDPPRHRGREARHGRPRRPPDRPGVPRRPGRAAARPGATPPTWPRGSTRAGPPGPRPRTNPRGGGTIYLATVDARGQRGQPDRVELPRASARAWSIRRPASTTRTGAATSASTRTTPTSWSRASGRSTRCCPGCCSGTGRAATRGSSPGRWAAMPSRRSTPSSCRPLVDGGVDVATAVARAALVRRAGRPLRAAGRRPPRAAPRAGRRRGARGARPPGHARRAVRQRTSAMSTRSNWSRAARRAGGSLAAATDPRSAGLPAVW